MTINDENYELKKKIWESSPREAFDDFLNRSVASREADGGKNGKASLRESYAAASWSLINTFADYLKSRQRTTLFQATENHILAFFNELKDESTTKLKRASRVRFLYLNLLNRIYRDVGMLENPADAIIKASLVRRLKEGAVDEDGVVRQPGKRVKGESIRATGSDEPMAFLSPSQVDRFIGILMAEKPPSPYALAKEKSDFVRDRAMIMLMLFAGLKATHITGLFPRNVYRRARDLSQQKASNTSPPLLVELSPALTGGADGWHRPEIEDERAKQAIDAWVNLRLEEIDSLQSKGINPASDWLLFPGRWPGPGSPESRINVATIYRMVTKAMKKAGLDEVVAHTGCRTLRNTWVLGCIADGVDIDELQNMLGLKDERSMQWYTEAYRLHYVVTVSVNNSQGLVRQIVRKISRIGP